MTMEADVPAQRTSLISDPPGLVFGDLKPGDSVDATVTVTNSAPYPVRLSDHVTRDGQLFQGAHPLVVSFTVTPDAGSARCAALDDALPAHATVTVHVSAAFPPEAGNEYQAQSGTATLFFTATQVAPEQCDGAVVARPPRADTPPHLPNTGIEVSGVVVLAVALLVLGVAARAAFRRREGRREHE
ncbi:LPXTG cell wall anchor domain-containing protein [Leifsonia sp. NCR5]|uniref:LPXTG cell wall anchor domain-containing protein n=1 Tax=Leifsonia sp. NCR5 TaxID=1978342 RepID=UPI000A18E8C1|nr:LPXTG cell wall anchor domain-containing protein [Leifsonia sp. NCR5]